MQGIRDILHDNFKAGDRVSVGALPARIGVRETENAVCRHRLSEREVLEGSRFDDAIAKGSYRVDIHHPDREGLTFRYLDGRGGCGRVPSGLGGRRRGSRTWTQDGFEECWLTAAPSLFEPSLGLHDRSSAVAGAIILPLAACHGPVRRVEWKSL